MLLASRGTARPFRDTPWPAAAEVNWTEFVAVTVTHRIAPLVLAGLSTASPPGVPDFVLQRLRRRAHANRLRVMVLRLEMARIAAAFRTAGFELTLLKGAALSASAYGDPALRHAGDLDLLTEERDLDRKLALLENLGYSIAEPEGVRLNARRLHIYRRHWKGVTLRHRRQDLAVDLHWRLFNGRNHPGNRLLQPSTAENGAPGRPLFAEGVRTLPEQDTFLYCALHGASDGWVYLKGLCDIAAFLRRLTPAELAGRLERARELGLLRETSSAVRLAGELLDEPAEHPLLLPADEPFHRRQRQAMLLRLRQQAFRPQRRPAGPLDYLRHEWSLAPGWRTGWEIADRFLWRPRVWALLDLPDELLWLHPVAGLLLPPRRAAQTSLPVPRNMVPPAEADRACDTVEPAATTTRPGN